MKEKEDVHTLRQEDAEKALLIPKLVTERGKAKTIVKLDLMQSNDFRFNLCPSDSIDKHPEYLLRIRISNKMRTKVTLHTQEGSFSCCLFRVDFNGPAHTNPAEVNEYVPEFMKPFAGMMIGGNHVHYHVQGFPSAVWAIPVEYDPFPVKDLDLSDYYTRLKEVVAAVSDFIHLETKILIIEKLMYDGMD